MFETATSTRAERSRIPQFYRLSIDERLHRLGERGLLDETDLRLLRDGRHLLQSRSADRMVENVVGVFGLPLGIGLNLQVNGRAYAVPMVLEEPSVIAGLSAAAKLITSAGGVEASSDDPLLIGQIQLASVPSAAAARRFILGARQEILNLANSLHPRMVARGGGARDVEVVVHPGTSVGDMVVVHLLVDTRDAMGANLVNSMCEGVAPLVARLAGGLPCLRVLSNLADRAMVRARAVIPVELFGGSDRSPAAVRDGIVLASELALLDPYRAATHNKGIMNGIDAVALATGNDWRAVEAAAHAHAGRGPRYTALAAWSRDEQGALVGELEMPLKVGIVGAPMQSNPAVGVSLRLLGVESARELAEVMAGVGLAQNMAALRALVTDGIQHGHMSLHARTVAAAAGAPTEAFEVVVSRLVESGEIKTWKAEEIVRDLCAAEPAETQGSIGEAYGKIILLGEHAVVYGSRAVAVPIPMAIRARVRDRSDGIRVGIPAWGVDRRLRLDRPGQDSLEESISLVLRRLGLDGRTFDLEVQAAIPRAMGLGGSAALAVAVIRALTAHFDLDLDEDEVNQLAHACEDIAHGTASGIDNTLATYGRPMLFQRAEPPLEQDLGLRQPIPLVVGITGRESLTAGMVARVQEGWQQNRPLYESLFSSIDDLAGQAAEALQDGDLPRLGALMNVNQGLLNALQVSSPELELLIQTARDHGALGAKITGGGGGGSIVALCPDTQTRVADAIRAAGFEALEVEVV